MIRYTAVLLIFVSSVFAQSDAAWREWNKPFEPFRIIGNIYYVGATNVSSFAIKTNKGIILIDGGFSETAPQILENLKKLGLDPKQVKILLNSHAHFDHAGGLAELKRVTGAKLYAAEADKRLLEEGGHNDFAFGDSMLFPKVKVDHAIHSGERVTLGDAELTATVTPGHTKGCTTWSMRTMEGKAEYSVVFVCSLSAPGYKLVNNPKNPNIVDDYQHSFGMVKKMRADVFLNPHGELFQLKERYERLQAGDKKAFVDPTALRRYVESSEESFNKELEKQRAAASTAKPASATK